MNNIRRRLGIKLKDQTLMCYRSNRTCLHDSLNVNISLLLCWVGKLVTNNSWKKNLWCKESTDDGAQYIWFSDYPSFTHHIRLTYKIFSREQEVEAPVFLHIAHALAFPFLTVSFPICDLYTNFCYLVLNFLTLLSSYSGTLFSIIPVFPAFFSVITVPLI